MIFKIKRKNKEIVVERLKKIELKKNLERIKRGNYVLKYGTNADKVVFEDSSVYYEKVILMVVVWLRFMT